MKQAHTFLEFTGLRALGPNTFETTSLSTSGPTGRAFGGCTIAATITAASATVSSQFRLYSALGNFLGGALADRSLICTVKTIRTTRSFATRLVEVAQKLDGGEVRVCMVVIADFQLPDTVPAELEYSQPPTKEYSRVENCPTNEGIAERMIAESKISPKGLQALRLGIETDTMRTRSVEAKYCPEGILGQTLMSATGHNVKTTQDHLPMYEKTSAEWFRSRENLATAAQQCAFMAYIMDGPTSWLPLLHEQRSVASFSAVASLEFALRFFSSDIDCNEWHMREIKSTAAGECRTFFEGKVWDAKGKLVASMTQQDIARPKQKL